MDNAEMNSSFQEALKSIDKAAQAYEEEDETILDLSLWKAFSEIEYSSFLFSLKTDNREQLKARRKRVSRIEIESSLKDARAHIQESLRLIKEESPKELNEEIEEAKTSIFNAIRKLKSIRRRQRRNSRNND